MFFNEEWKIPSFLVVLILIILILRIKVSHEGFAFQKS